MTVAEAGVAEMVAGNESVVEQNQETKAWEARFVPTVDTVEI